MDFERTRCLIIDDEPLASALIRKHLGKLPSFEVAGECRNAIQAMEILRGNRIDLMFLDLRMPEISGFDFLRSLPNPPRVIITTAFREFAIEGYDFDIVDFLLKPISFERFLKAINRYHDRSRPLPGNSGNHLSDPENKYLFIQDGKNNLKVYYEDILYFEGYGEYVKVFTTQKKYMVRNSLNDYENRLLSGSFHRVHKSYIVNLRKITGFNSNHLLLKDTEIPVGRSYREQVMKLLRSYTKG